MAQSAASLKTVIRNSGTGSKRFSFLPPHGVVLAEGEEMTIRGDLVTAVSRGNPERGKRHLLSLETALVNGDLEIVESPRVFLYDDTNDITKVLDLDSDTLGTLNPSYSDSASEA